MDPLWIPDHLLNPLKGENAPSLEAWTLATAVAEATEEVNISHTTLCEAFRYPAVLAKQASTLQGISGGRFWLSIGAGWFKREYEAYGLDFLEHDERIEKAGEAIDILKRLWKKEGVDYQEITLPSSSSSKPLAIFSLNFSSPKIPVPRHPSASNRTYEKDIFKLFFQVL